MVRCQNKVTDLRPTLNNFGFYTHQRKSVLKPTKCLKFLGFFINTNDMTISLMAEKIQRFCSMAHYLLETGRPKIRQVAVLIVNMVAYVPAVIYEQVHIKSLEIDKNKALSQLWKFQEAYVYISAGPPRHTLVATPHTKLSKSH